MSETRALIVDDVASSRLLAEKYLKLLGWQTVSVDSGEDALAAAAAGDFQLVLLDISMPGLSGEETCRRLRALPLGASLYIIAYTAHAFPEERLRFLGCGFDEILVKPVERETLTSLLAAAFPSTGSPRAD
ncbi:response regulator [Dechloromonas sp. ZY10]|uniref:response regulator n=1 Tax=Dechloromonas aquae TaxID=2664436 RepID=UPI003529C223